MKRLLLLFTLLLAVQSVKRIKDEETDALEAKFSLRKPFLTADGGKINNGWTLAGDAQYEQSFLRLNPQTTEKSGLVYHSEGINASNWEVTMQFGVSQASVADGEGEGIAFWYVATPGQLGEAFGAKNVWKGLAVIFDTRDDTEEEGSEKDSFGPYITIQTNDGSHEYDPIDGRKNEIGGCSIGSTLEQGALPKNFWIKMKIRYINGKISVFYRHKPGSSYINCAINIPLSLPNNYHLQLSSSTDDESTDTHTVYSVRYYDLSPIITYDNSTIIHQLKAIEELEENDHPLHLLKQSKGKKNKANKKEEKKEEKREEKRRKK